MPVECFVRRGCIVVFEEWDEGLAVDVGLDEFDACELSDGGQPVTAVCDVIADLIMWEMSGPGDDGRDSDATFEEREFCPTVWAGGSSASVSAFFM